MATKRKYRSEVAKAVHEGVRGMHRLGLVDKKTMREFDVRCFTTVDDLSAEDIQALRERAGVSQSVMAKCLNVTTKLVLSALRLEVDASTMVPASLVVTPL